MFSDGAYEISGRDGRARQLADLIQELGRPTAEGDSKLDSLINWAQEVRNNDAPEDDVSLMELEL